MMSLFSSFDLNFFFPLHLVVFSFLFFNLVYFSNFSINFFSSIFFSLSSFFYSLKSKNFTKSSIMLVLSIIFLIFFFNFFAVFPFNFSLTSQFSMIFFFSLVIWVSFILFNLFCNMKGLLFHFIPEGTPIYLTMVLFLIEMISNFIRPLTLTVRLVANILAGHLLLILLSKLVFNLPVMFLFYLGLNLVELFVSLIQAYIFSTMIVLYFSEIH